MNRKDNDAPADARTSGSSAEILWEKGWDGHKAAQSRRLANLPLSVKLQWLEEAQKLIRHFEEARARKARN